MTPRDWIVSIYAGAAAGGVFWAGLPMVTSLREFPRPPHAALTTVAVATVAGIVGLALFHAAGGAKGRRFGAAVTIAAFIGIPVLAWFALW